MLCGDSEERRAAAGARSWKERWRRLFSCHIISGAVVNKGPPRPPGPLHSRMQVGARFSSPPQQHGRQQRRHCEPPSPLALPPVLSPGLGRRLLNWLYSSQAK